MRVLLINPKMYYRRGLPLGLAYIAAVLRENGHDVKVYDPAPYDKTTLQQALKRFQPECVGIACMSPSFFMAAEMAAQVKQYADIPVIFGGVHPTSMPLETLENKNIDYIVIGEGEITCLELVNAIEKQKPVRGIKGIGFKDGKRKALTSPRPLIENMDTIPLPARDLFPMRWYTQRSTQIRGSWYRQTGMFTSRGCPSDCVFCASKIMFGRRFRPRSTEKVVDEIEMLLGKYRLEALTFDDDSFAVNRERAINICKEIRKRKLDFIWHAQMRTDTVHDDVVQEMAKSGCIQASFGVESGSLKVLKAMHKGNSPEDAIRAFGICKKYGIKTLANFMLGNPEETLEDIEMTRQLAHKLDADYNGFYITMPYPGTELYRMARENNWIGHDMDFSGLIQGPTTNTERQPMMKINIDPQELKRIRNQIESEFIKKELKTYLKNRQFVVDMVLMNLAMPQTMFRAISKCITSGKSGVLNELIRAEEIRRFP